MTVPLPWHAAEMKIQPSPGRLNEYEVRGPEIDATSSSLETRLFSFRSPEKTTVPSAPAATALLNTAIVKERKAIFFIDKPRSSPARGRELYAGMRVRRRGRLPAQPYRDRMGKSTTGERREKMEERRQSSR